MVTVSARKTYTVCASYLRAKVEKNNDRSRNQSNLNMNESKSIDLIIDSLTNSFIKFTNRNVKELTPQRHMAF